jgi:hydrogenase maturation protein HypF
VMHELSLTHNLQTETPPLVRVASISSWAEPSSIASSTFNIQSSFEAAICPECERELFDPHNRRYLYPFISCASCGPRFTKSGDISCDDCLTEYQDSQDRRFHSHTVACSKCGPFVTLRASHSNISTIEYRLSAILRTRRLLREGGIVAVKNLSGFHIVCDAYNPMAVEQLHQHKNRAEKPFVIMAADLAVIEKNCSISSQEKDLMSSREKPIVLLDKKRMESFPIAAAGMTLPHTPLHHLLLNQTDPILARESTPSLLVITTGDFSEESATIEMEALLAGSNQGCWSK